MLIRKPTDLTCADVTPKSIYLDRRKFLQRLGVAGVTSLAGKRVFDLDFPPRSAFSAAQLNPVKSPFSTREKMNTFGEVTHYNNFYEFGVDKDQPAKNAQHFVTSPWTVAVSGEVAKPRKFSMEEIG